MRGRVCQVVGLTVGAHGPASAIGELCYLVPHRARPGIPAEVVGFRDNLTLLMPFGELQGVGPGCEVVVSGHGFRVGVGQGLLGRVLDGLGRPIDGQGPVVAQARRATRAAAPDPLQRPVIDEALPVGVRALDGFLTCGKGQRMGIFSGSGVGKSTLLGMVARNTAADVSVIALVGERGREVREFLDRDLGPAGLARSVVVVATSDQPALVRIQAAYTATTIAEFFRDRGADVVLLMDSITRFAMALREVGLAIGEPPATRGYTPSVFATLPKLLERAGRAAAGSVTGFYTVLIDGDDLTEPVTDAMRGLLDGHVLLSRELAARGQYPAVDILGSVSRLMPAITDRQQQASAARLRAMLAVYRDAQDLISVGAYRPGSNPEIDAARGAVPQILAFLRQDVEEAADFAATRERLLALSMSQAEPHTQRGAASAVAPGQLAAVASTTGGRL
ncbi:MAG: FliI/YscN family ATPase [Bacillota bacterium]|nr:FliI/YscN family ATPase [Bacillota bacterium]